MFERLKKAWNDIVNPAKKDVPLNSFVRFKRDDGGFATGKVVSKEGNTIVIEYNGGVNNKEKLLVVRNQNDPTVEIV